MNQDPHSDTQQSDCRFTTYTAIFGIFNQDPAQQTDLIACYCFWIRDRDPGKAKIAVFRIHLFFGYPDPLVGGMDPDPALDPDPSIIMQKIIRKPLTPTIL